ncbi:hypothetical protein AWC29_12760 [Mycobacterium triplex]|uniref:Transmembrane protein n=1 Tax=Mycobacterium triplex TaxID=47839 RepID=A0A024K1M2_9MYCO|nr:DUF202 domain-containing protein [Mycobacterium triplex]ORX04776.1 hypothetical protein AWC29_12760 [Mycobacterium triplex]CDO89398.1 transmembrane protein [Mycobacterium triplex]
MTQSTAAGDPFRGLQAERTVLAWSRTSFAFLANGVLLAIKEIHGARGWMPLIPAGVALLAAMGTYVIAFRRQATLQRRPLPVRISPRRPVYVIGVATLLLIAMATAALLV